MTGWVGCQAVQAFPSIQLTPSALCLCVFVLIRAGGGYGGSVEVGPAAKEARIWLIAPDWQVRALVRAQLLEAGYDVTAAADWEALLQEEEVMAPGLLIAELTGDEPPDALTLLRAFPARRLVLRGAGAPAAAALRAAGIDAVLSRPFSVGDVVRAARRLLSGALSSERKAFRSPALERPGSDAR